MQGIEHAPQPQRYERSPRGEERLVIHGVSWKDYMIVREALDVAGLRMTYLEGMLEVTRFVRLGDQHEAARAYRDWLRAEHPG